LGPQKYDDLCAYVLEKAKARAALVIVIEDGHAGMGLKAEFSLAGGKFYTARLPRLLRRIADEIEESEGI
jgi:hypothetical protein